MSAIVGKIANSGEPIIIAAKSIVSIHKETDPDEIVVTTITGDRIGLADLGTFEVLCKWFEAFLKSEIER